jgi:hypothetical protein
MFRFSGKSPLPEGSDRASYAISHFTGNSASVSNGHLSVELATHQVRGMAKESEIVISVPFQSSCAGALFPDYSVFVGIV